MEAPRKGRRKVKVAEEKRTRRRGPRRSRGGAAGFRSASSRTDSSASRRGWRAGVSAARPSASPSANSRRTAPQRPGRAALRRLPDRAARARNGGRIEDDEEDEDESTPRARKPRAARRSRSAAAKYVLPSLDVLSAPKARRAHDALERRHPGQRHRARRRARRLRRARRDHQCAPGPGGHALRAGARARHQIVARDRALRRHRPLHERAVRTRRGGVRPQRHRHRAAQSDPREGLSARIARGRRLQRDLGQAAALPRQDHRRRVRHRRSHAHAASA